MIDFELYGGKRAYFSHLKCRVQLFLGAYGDLRRVDWAGTMRLVFVCRGNICRSPYAAERARSLGFHAVSFGLDAIDGAQADSTASRIAQQRGISLRKHKSTRFLPSHIVEGDLLIAFEPQQLSDIPARRIEGVSGTTLIGVWAKPASPYIQDPFGRSDRYFQRCFSMIDENLLELTRHLAGFNRLNRNRKTHISGTQIERPDSLQVEQKDND